MKMVKSIKRNSAGFTLLEVLFAAMLIGLAISALVSSSGAFTMYNAAGLDLSTSEFLIEEVREMTAPDIFANLSVYNGQVYNPPRDADGTAMPEFAAYTQTVTVEYVNPADLAAHSASATAFRRITVAITKNGNSITSASWIYGILDK
jgi:type II secretory pathway pseudopilin PulG